MTNSVQEKVKTDWGKAQKEGGQRIGRIRKIVKIAAVEALSELKDGSSEIESMGRQSLAEMIDQLKAKEAAEAETIVVEQVIEASVDEVTEEPKIPTSAPTWQEIFSEILHLINDRKIHWAEQLLVRLQTQMAQFDADIAAEYGVRYRPFQPLVRGLRSLIDLAHNRVAKPGENPPAEPITIEVLDGTETPVNDSANAEN